MKKIIGHVAVDSGQIIIVDPCYVLDDKKYKTVCDITLSGQPQGEFIASGIAGNAVCSPTATGDGNYPVMAEYAEDGQIKKLTIEFDTW